MIDILMVPTSASRGAVEIGGFFSGASARPWHDESSKLQEIGSQSWRDLII